MKMKIRNKMKKGLSLVALVVTIIVMLLLAGVSISLIVGPDGAIKKGKESKLESRYATILERVKLRETTIELSKAKGEDYDSPEEFIQKLIDEDLLTGEDSYNAADFSELRIGLKSDGTYTYYIPVITGEFIE